LPGLAEAPMTAIDFGRKRQFNNSRSTLILQVSIFDDK